MLYHKKIHEMLQKFVEEEGLNACRIEPKRPNEKKNELAIVREKEKLPENNPIEEG